MIGFLAMAGACYLLIDNRGALSGAGDALFIKLIPWVVLVVFLIGCGVALWMRRQCEGPLRGHRPLRPRRGTGGTRMSMLDAPPDPAPAGAADGRRRSGGRRAILKAEKGLGADGAVRLHHPARAAQGAPCRPASAVPREAFVVLYERSERKTYEAVVSLTDEDVVSWRHIEGVQSPITFEEFMACEEARPGRPGLAGGDAQARRRGLLAGDDRPVGRRLHGRGGRPDRRGGSCGR